MGNTWVTNILHYLDEEGAFAVKSGPARRIAERTCAIVEAVTSRPADADRVTAVRCRRRPGRKPCIGAIIAGYAEGDATTIVWGCPICGDEGHINGWQETQWDKRKVCPSEARAPIRPAVVGPASMDDVVFSVRRIRVMSKAERTLLCDEVYNRQPALLAHVLVLSRLGVPMEKVDRVLHILLILYDLFSRTSPAGLPPVSEETLERVNANQLALLKLMNTEERSEARRLCRLSVESHPEINVLAFIIGDLGDAGITDMSKREDEYCVRAARNLLDAIVQVRGRPGGDSPANGTSRISFRGSSGPSS